MCPLCGSGLIDRRTVSARSIYAPQMIGLSHCQTCEHLYLDPDTKTSGFLYESFYRYDAHELIAGEKRWRGEKTLARLEKYLPENYSVVDLGCMYGYLLETFRKRGYEDLRGIEMDEQAVRVAQARGNRVEVGTWESLFRGDYLDRNKPVILVLSHSLEHFKEAREFLRRASAHLSASSRLLILVPNAQSRTARWFGRYWGWWQVPAHWHHFSRGSLARVLSQEGFETVVSFTCGADSLFWVSTLAALLGQGAGKNPLTGRQRWIIRIFSWLARWWYHAGDEELVVVAQKK